MTRALPFVRYDRIAALCGWASTLRRSPHHPPTGDANFGDREFGMPHRPSWLIH
jgi:hypothetical protein